ncbi:unnamed protein product [Chrysodeixis includens]|uniref:Choline/ethanolamine kinase n=1 Tax=Chrysodeixis includens TaxID=689277 RepID=A0A9P0BXC9_CHRIL|nr:unnamed protein product [Chrysodeixis includens]
MAKKLQMCGTEEEMREVAARICRNYLHGSWKTVDPKELDFKRINGGLSNFLYYVALPDDVTKLGGYVQRESSPDTEDPSKLSVIKKTGSVTYCAIEEPKKVLLRIYGQVHGERAMDAIVTESVVFTLLSERRLGPKLHGVFSGGRIEEYIPARPLLAQELADPALSMKIAEKMAAIHSMDVPLNKEPNYIWKTMGKWLKTVKEERLSPTTQGKNEEEQRMIKTLKAVDFDKEIEWLKKFLATLESPVVFCHNDMQEGNILLLEDNAQTSTDEEISSLFLHSYDSDQDKKDAYEISQFEDANTSDTIISRSSDIGEPKLVFIDFEYCAYNYRGFDIANHFQEWAYDYTNPEHPFYYENQDFCPNLEQKEIFIKQYLKHYTPNSQDDKKTDASLDDVNKLLDEVEAFACASHLFWTLWSIVNASKSQIPFGYWEYAISRLETYQRVKQEAIKKSQGLPQKRKICEVDI